MLTLWLMLSTWLYSLQLSPGSFPKPLTAEEEEHYVNLSAQGNQTARNILIEHNLRLVAHILKNRWCKGRFPMADRWKHGVRMWESDCDNLLESDA